MNYNKSDSHEEIITEPFCLHYQQSKGPGLMTNIHFHNYIEILYATRGEIEIWLNGNYYTFYSGDLVIINSGEVHQTNDIYKEGSGYICIRFDPAILYGNASNIYEMEYIIPFLTNHQPPQKIFRREEIENTSIPDTIHDMLYEFAKKEYAYELAVRTQIGSLFLWILRYWNRRGVNASQHVNYDLLGKLQPTIDYINNNIGEPITAKQMSEYSNLSYSYFTRCFKELTTMCFSDYLAFVRIRYAENLLLTTDMNITEIALEAGFSTSSYFISTFKKLKKTSPKQYRKIFEKK